MTTTKRCTITNNPCGRDTWALGNPPECECGDKERVQAEFMNKRVSDINTVDLCFIYYHSTKDSSLLTPKLHKDGITELRSRKKNFT